MQKEVDQRGKIVHKNSVMKNCRHRWCRLQWFKGKRQGENIECCWTTLNRKKPHKFFVGFGRGPVPNGVLETAKL